MQNIHFGLPSASSVGHTIGQGFSAIKPIVVAIKGVADVIFKTLAAIPKNMGKFAGIARKVEKYMLPFFQVCAERFGWLKAAVLAASLKDSLVDLADITEFFRISTPIDYFFNAKYKESSMEEFTGQVLSFGADLAGGVLFLNDIELIDLAKYAEKIGNLRVFNMFSKIPLEAVPLGLGGAAHLFFAYDSFFNKIPEAKAQLHQPVTDKELDQLKKKEFEGKTFADLNPVQQQEAIRLVTIARESKIATSQYDFVTCAAECVFDGCVIGGVTSVPVLAFIGTAYVVAAIGSVINGTN